MDNKTTWYEIGIFKNGQLIDSYGEYKTPEEAESDLKFETELENDDKRIKVKLIKKTGTIIYRANDSE